MGSTVFKSSLLAVFLCLVVASYAKSGKFTNCGSIPFNITWSPEPISPSQPLKVFFEYAFPNALDGGFYDVTIWFHGDQEPFMEFADSFSCDDITKYFACPIHKGFKFRGSHVFEHIPNIGSYPGDYDVRLAVTNQEKKPLICLKGHVIILKN